MFRTSSTVEWMYFNLQTHVSECIHGPEVLTGLETILALN